MADLTPLDEKLGEVLGLAQAARTVTETVSKMEGAGAFRDELETMGRQAEETERRTDALVDGLEGRKTAIPDPTGCTRSSRGTRSSTSRPSSAESLRRLETLVLRSSRSR
jgi:hypothetical protein